MADPQEYDTIVKRERDDDTEEDVIEPPVKQQRLSDDGGRSGGEAENEEQQAPSELLPVKIETHDASDLPPIKTESHSSPKTQNVEETPQPPTDSSENVDALIPVATTETAEPTTNRDKAAVVTSVPQVSHAPTPSITTAVPPGLPPAISPSNPDAIVEERGTVSALYVGRVIGKGGEMIRDLQARSSCRIDVDQNVPQGQPRVITYRGTRRTVDFAKKLVYMLCQENASEADLPLGDAKQEHILVPAQSVGKIIGRSGEMIRELQSRSHAKIQVDHHKHTGMEQQKHVTITGTELAVSKAKEMVLFLVANPHMDAMQSINMLIEDKLHGGGVWGSGPPYPNLPNMGQNMQPTDGRSGGDYNYDQQQPYYGGHQPAAAPVAQPYYAAPVPAPYSAPIPPVYQQPAHNPYGHYGGGGGGGGGVEIEVFYAAKQFMGRIIGSKGVTINDLQRRSSTDIQINQDVPPGQDCEITIRGSRPGIEMAKQMLREIIEIGPNHPYAGGGPPSNAGGYQASGYGQPQAGQYGYQSQQPVGYAQGYGQSYNPAPQAYNQGYQAPTHSHQAYTQPHAPYQPGAYSAPPVAAPPPVSEWKSATSPDGQIYYYNERTGQTQWDKPLGMP